MRQVDKSAESLFERQGNDPTVEATSLHKDNSSHWEMKLEADARACTRNCEPHKQKQGLGKQQGRL